jgi:3-hydroxyisobutyrate dehydrogenase
VAFIGVGNMGSHMARNLLGKGFQVRVFDKSTAAVDALAKSGATACASPALAATGAKVIVTMLPSNPHVRAVYTAEDGVLATASQNTLCIDSSTIDPSVAKEMAAAAAKRGVRFVDAPVSGGVGGAEKATLTFMVGGEKADFTAAQAVLTAMGKNIVHCGAVGTGQVAKLCNNMLLAISMIGTAEAMNLGVKNGMDPKLLAGILNTSSGRCWSSDTYNPCPGVMENVPSSRGYSGGFASALMLKDLGLAMDAAAASNASTPLGALARQVYHMISTHGLAWKDFSSVYEFLAAQNEPKK